MPKLKPAAFLSYVRFDDEHEDGRLSEFRKRLSGEVRMQTGEEFPIFQDRNDIRWGQNWQRRIDDSIDHSTFLICILTPGFFKSPACKNEIERFVEREKRLSREDLILAVYYVECPQFRDKKQVEKDKLAKVVFSRQYVDWRELRFEPFTSAEAGRSLARIATQIRDALHRPSGKSRHKAAVSKGGRLKRVRKPGPTVAATPTSGMLADVSPTQMGALAELMKTTGVPAPKNEPVTRVVDATGRGQYTAVSGAIAAASPGDRLLIRPGIYREHLTVDKPLELVGDGRSEEIVLTHSDDNVVSFSTTIGRITNVTIRLGEETKDTTSNAIFVSQGRLILENCQLFGGSAEVVHVQGGADPQISHNKITNLGERGGIAVADARGLIEGNEITTKTGFGIVVLGAHAAPIIRENVISSSLIGVKLMGSTSTIDGNDIGGGYVGIDADQGSDATVTRNRIHECGSGCRVSNGSRATIEGNTITNNSTSGIEVESGAKVTITGNVLAENGAYGITADAGSYVTLGENTFRDNKNGDIDRPKSAPSK